MFYYRIENHVVCSRIELASFDKISEQEAEQANHLIYVSNRTGNGKHKYRINHRGYLADAAEGLWCLDRNQLNALADSMEPVPEWLADKADAGNLTGICADIEQIEKILSLKTDSEKKTVHILAMGDVGGTLLIGMALMGGDCVKEIGIYDFNENLCHRWEHEINQISFPWDYERMPKVKVLKQEELFQCDVFVFCASKSIPPVGSEVQDVRMAQLEANSAIISQYGKMARDAGFKGLFAVVSDPVDPLCQRVWAASNRNENGIFDGRGLRPEQIQGYGLGVMNSRAAYYAKQDKRFSRFLTEGRAYGPHGQRLVIADSVDNYNHELSMELTKKTVEANLEVRALGYKPYIAPAISSAAISILLTIRGQWHYSSNYLGGIFMGAKNRSTAYGVELEHLALPDALLERLQAVVDDLNQSVR
ncbi:MAG: lactate dehydrogenase [Peptococcaceae bacterium]|nr:lactate dehydrogenase [Peptococcaceae bacterium]